MFIDKVLCLIVGLSVSLDMEHSEQSHLIMNICIKEEEEEEKKEQKKVLPHFHGPTQNLHPEVGECSRGTFHGQPPKSAEVKVV